MFSCAALIHRDDFKVLPNFIEMTRNSRREDIDLEKGSSIRRKNSQMPSRKTAGNGDFLEAR